MGLKRWLWRSSKIVKTVDTIKNIKDEGSIIGGVKKTVGENYKEDNPLTSAIYRSGKYDGKKEGYSEASEQYEAKLIEQADRFLQQKEVFESERNAYEELLTEYEMEIDKLTNKLDRTQEENRLLQNLLLKERQLRNIA